MNKDAKYADVADSNGLVDLDILLIEETVVENETASLAFTHIWNRDYRARVHLHEGTWLFTIFPPQPLAPISIPVRSRLAGIQAALEEGFDIDEW